MRTIQRYYSVINIAKRLKTKRRAGPDIQQQLATTLQTLRTLRTWEDQAIKELERLCSRLPRRLRQM